MSESPLLLFYPTSPVHVIDLKPVLDRLPGWDCAAILYQPLSRVAPGIYDAIRHCEKMGCIVLDENNPWEAPLPDNAKIVVIGAAFEPFAIELVAWAKLRNIPVIAIEEVAQLALNQCDINNYDVPLDRLFVASPDERRRFLSLGYPPEMLRVSGLLANDRFDKKQFDRERRPSNFLSISDDSKPIVYTTSPLRSRMALHNKDDQGFRENVLTQLADAARRTVRRVVVKLHPNEDVESQRGLVKKIIPDAVVVGREISMHELFPITGVLVNRGNSQTCLEAVLRGVPTVVAACGLKTLFHQHGGAYVVESIDALATTVEEASARGPLDITAVKTNYFYLPSNGVANYVAEEIVRLADDGTALNERFWEWLIRSMLFVGRHDRALALCEKLPTRSPGQELLHRALQAHSERRLADAVSSWAERAAVDPPWYFPHYELAHGYQVTRQFEKAITHAHKAIELHPRFHSLWHEIPMRVVIMASQRSMGDLAAAKEQLNGLANRGLLEIVPELLIEAAAQHCYPPYHFDEAERCLEKAVEQLTRYPVEPRSDSQILARLTKQYVNLAAKYAEANESTRSRACIARAIELVGSDVAAPHDVSSHLGYLGEELEKTANYRDAEHCYTLALQANPSAQWVDFQRSRMELKERHLKQAIQSLLAIANIPNAPRAVIEKILSPAGAVRLAPYWPASPKSVVKPLVLCLYMIGWFCIRCVRPGRHDFPHSIAALALVWLFITRHFAQRLRTGLSKMVKICSHRITFTL